MKLFFAILTVIATLYPLFTCAGDSLSVSDGWARAAEEGRDTQVFFTVHNGTKEADTLLSVESKAANAASLQQGTVSEDGTSAASAVDKLTIAADKDYHLRPGKYFVQLSGLQQPLVPGATIHVTLTFEKAGAIDQSILIEKATATKYQD